LLVELSKGHQAAAREGVKPAGGPGGRQKGNHQVEGAAEGLQSERRQISGLIVTSLFLLFSSLLPSSLTCHSLGNCYFNI
jgi:hypothetical protein